MEVGTVITGRPEKTEAHFTLSRHLPPPIPTKTVNPHLVPFLNNILPFPWYIGRGE